MVTTFTRRLCRNLSVVLVALLLLTGAGCQTFTLSEEDFQKQQRGEVVDPEVADAVAVVGTVAAVGIIIGELVAELTK
jgi:hypothetical protein